MASTNCASINELAQLGTFNTRAHGPWVSRFCATGAHVPPSISVPHLGLQLNTVKKGNLRLACAVSSTREAPLTQTTEQSMSQNVQFDSYLEARLQAAPLLLEIFRACKQTWSRKTSLCATSCVSPAPKAPLSHNCG